MATSGSVSFTQTRNELVFDALQLIGVYGIGRTVSSEDMIFSSNMLNKMVKAWGTKGLHLFSKEEAVLYITPNVGEYTLGGSAKAANVSDTVETKLDGQFLSGSTALTVLSTTGMAVSDKIGVVLEDLSIHWTTIATIPTSTTLTISVGLTGDALEDALVYTYTNTINKPLRVIDARRRTGFDNGATSDVIDISLSQVRHEEYFSMPNKTSGGVCVEYHYLPKLTTGSLYLWSRPTDGRERIMFTYERIIEDLNSASDDFDFPSEWLEALTYQLAVRLARPFGKASALQDLLPIASTMLDDLLAWDNEIGTMDMTPDMGWSC